MNNLKYLKSFSLKFLYPRANFNFSRNNNTKNYTIEPEYSIVEEDLYIPKEKLEFIDNLSLIYDYPMYKTSRNGLIFLFLLFFGLGAHCFRKIYNYNERSKTGIIIYGFGFIFFVNRMKFYPNAFRSIIKKISLCNDGKNIIMEHSNYFIIPSKKHINISNIQRPINNENISVFNKFGYPILMNNEMYLIPRNADIVNKELMPIIMNGKYIKMQSNLPKNLSNVILEKKVYSNVHYSLIILNTPLNLNFMMHLFELVDYVVCGDGGANQLYNILNEENRVRYLPHYILGDFDSILPEIKTFYEKNGVKCVQDFCQDTSDVEKTLNFLIQNIIDLKNYDEHRILITGCLGSRMDHNLGALNNLIKYSNHLREKKLDDRVSIQIFDENTLISCLLPGKTIYQRSKLIERKNGGVGIIPLCGPCNFIETSGLKWNLGGELNSLEFGKFISTSNEFEKDVVEITNSDPVLFISDLEPAFIQK